jgi:glycerol kinase
MDKMLERYLLKIDQSTSAVKVMLFDALASLVVRVSLPTIPEGNTFIQNIGKSNRSAVVVNAF